MTNGSDALQSWSISRRFQRSVDNPRVALGSHAPSPDNPVVQSLLQSAERDAFLRTLFACWKEVTLDRVRAKEFEADCLFNLVASQRCFGRWRARLERKKREEEREKQAVSEAFHSMLVMRKHLATWRAYSRLMVARHRLRKLEVPREKVSNFLKKIETFKKQLVEPRTTKSEFKRTKQLKPDLKTSETRSVKVTTKELTIRKRQIERQKVIIESQRTRMKKQQKEIDQLKEMKNQLDLGRPVTNQVVYKELVANSGAGMAARGRLEIHSRDLMDLGNGGRVVQSLVRMAVKEAVDSKSKNTIRNIVVDNHQVEKRQKKAAEFYYGDDDTTAEAVPPDPDFVISMKLRQQQRNRKRDAIRRFHQAKDEEKERRKREAEAIRLREKQEEKRCVKEERRNLRRQMKNKEEAMRQRRETLLTFCRQADGFYNKTWLPRHFGLLPWKRLLNDARLKRCVAEMHHLQRTRANAFVSWLSNSKQSSYESTLKMSNARVQYLRNLLRNKFESWSQVPLINLRKMQTAEDFHNGIICCHAVKRWWHFTQDEEMRQRVKNRTSISFHDRLLMRNSLNGWIKFHKEKDVIEAREALKIRLENKIRLDIPDYVPFSTRAQVIKMAAASASAK